MRQLGINQQKIHPKVDHWVHRQAIQIAAQMPDDLVTALAVLDRAKELLTCWDHVGVDEADPPSLRVVTGREA